MTWSKLFQVLRNTKWELTVWIFKRHERIRNLEGKNNRLALCADLPHPTSNLVISSHCFVANIKRMRQNEKKKSTCGACRNHWFVCLCLFCFVFFYCRRRCCERSLWYSISLVHAMRTYVVLRCDVWVKRRWSNFKCFYILHIDDMCMFFICRVQLHFYNPCWVNGHYNFPIWMEKSWWL